MPQLLRFPLLVSVTVGMLLQLQPLLLPSETPTLYCRRNFSTAGAS
jgi:hypothetical protein